MPASLTSADNRRIPELAVKICFALTVVSLVFLPAGYGRFYIFDANGLGIPTDFINV